MSLPERTIKDRFTSRTYPKNKLTFTTELDEGGFYKVPDFKGNEPKSSIQDYIYRDIGLQKKIWKHSLLYLAMTEPNRYIEQKKKALLKIVDNMKQLFKIEFERTLQIGKTEEEARKRATTFALSYKETQIRDHNKEFPESFTAETSFNLISNAKKEK